MTARRVTVDLSAYPDLIIVYLGMRVNVLTGIKTLLGFGPKIASSVPAQPKDSLLHEAIVCSLFPPHSISSPLIWALRNLKRRFESGR